MTAVEEHSHETRRHLHPLDYCSADRSPAAGSGKRADEGPAGRDGSDHGKTATGRHGQALLRGLLGSRIRRPGQHGHSGRPARSRPRDRQSIPVCGAEGRRSRPRQHQFHGFRSIAFQGGPRRVSGVSPTARRLQGAEAADLAGYRRGLQAGRPQPCQEARHPSEQDAGRDYSRLQP